MKKIRLAAVFVLLAVLLAGCSTNSLESYKKAVEKTDGIMRGQSSGEVKVEMDFNTTGMTEEQVKKMNYYKDVACSFNVTFDEEARQTLSRNYLNLGGLGFDMDFYKNGEESFVKMPIIGKYVKLSDMINQAKEQQAPQEAEELISKETLESLGKAWVDLLKQENVMKGKQIVQSTPDGEVKATQYTMKLSDEQIKALLSAWTDTLSGDEKLKAAFEDSFKDKVKDLEDVSYDKLFTDIKDNLKSYRIEEFQYDAFVDIDGYIVNEVVSCNVSVNDTKPGGMTAVRFQLETKNWSINKAQQFEFPVLTEENTLDADSLEQNMPSAFEDLLKKKE